MWKTGVGDSVGLSSVLFLAHGTDLKGLLGQLSASWSNAGVRGRNVMYNRRQYQSMTNTEG